MKQDGHYNVNQQITYCCAELENLVKKDGVIGIVSNIGLCLKTQVKPYLLNGILSFLWCYRKTYRY